MKEFIDKLIERLEEEREISYADFYEYLMKYDLDNDFDEDDDWFYKGLIRAISIVNQLTKEYKPCNKPSCKDCEVYDKEKHYCPKWCDVIKHTTEELAEEYNNDFCEWRITPERPYSEEYKGYITSCGAYRGNILNDTKFCGCCGKRIKVIPYQPKGD